MDPQETRIPFQGNDRGNGQQLLLFRRAGVGVGGIDRSMEIQLLREAVFLDDLEFEQHFRISLHPDRRRLRRTALAAAVERRNEEPSVAFVAVQKIVVEAVIFGAGFLVGHAETPVGADLKFQISILAAAQTGTERNLCALVEPG